MPDYRGFYTQYIDLPNEEGSGDFISLKCPFDEAHKHADKKPSAGVNLSNGVFNCHVCGSLSPATFLQKHLGLDFSHASVLVDEYRRENQLTEKVKGLFTNAYIADPRWAAMYRRSLQGLEEVLASEENELGRMILFEYMKSRGLELQTLKDFGVGYLQGSENSWNKSVLVFPYILNNKVVGLRYRDYEGNKGGEKGCHFCLWRADQLDDKTKIAVIGEGETDTMRIYQELLKEGMGPEQGVKVVGTPSARFALEWVREFEGIESKIIIPQADEPSEKLVKKAREALSDLEVVRLPWRRRQIGKDTCEWLVENSSSELRALVETAVGSSRYSIMTGHELREAAAKESQEYDRWVITNLVQRQQVVLCGGLQKSYKTWFTLEMIRALITPEPQEFLGIPGFVRGRPQPYKVMMVEEEGNLEELYERAEAVLGDLPGWEDQTVWYHNSRLRLDDESSIYKLEQTIEKHKIDFLILDPFSDLFTAEENDNTEMGVVWRNIKRVKSRFPNLVVWVIHHFGKGSPLTEKWDAFRGAGRNAQSADLGVFIEAWPLSKGFGINFLFDGRSLKQLDIPGGTEYYMATFDKKRCRLEMTSKEVLINKHLALQEELKHRKLWEVNEAAKFFSVSTETIKAWVKKLADDVHWIAGKEGIPAQLKYVGKM